MVDGTACVQVEPLDLRAKIHNAHRSCRARPPPFTAMTEIMVTLSQYLVFHVQLVLKRLEQAICASLAARRSIAACGLAHRCSCVERTSLFWRKADISTLG